MTDQKNPFQIQKQNEVLVVQLLGWTEAQVVQATSEEIDQALQLHHKSTILKKQQLPPVTAPDVIIALPCLQSQRQLSPTLIPQRTPQKDTLPPQHTPQTETTPSRRQVTPQKDPVHTPPKQDPTPQKDIITPHEHEVKHATSDTLSKTPGFVREPAKAQLTEESCRELINQLKQLQRRRAEHEALLAKPNLVESSDIMNSLERTNKYIQNCLQSMWIQKDQIANALESKKSLVAWTDATLEPHTIQVLNQEVSKLLSLLKILNEGLEPA